ncbi:hypothetical protein HDU80_002939, partial [Chytriomyces hyalinus]
DTAIVTAIEEAAVGGQMEALSLLLSCSSSDPQPLSLDGALNQAVLAFKLDCIEAILNDRFKRVTCAGRDSALEQSVVFSDLPMSTLLVQYGVSFDCLTSVLYIAPQFVHQMLEQPGVDPGYLSYVLLLESMYKSDCNASRQILNEGGITIMVNNYAPVRKALEWRRTDHLLLFLEVAKRKSDTEPFKIVQKYLDQNETPDRFREPLLAGIEAIKSKFAMLNEILHAPDLDAADMSVWRQHGDQLRKMWEQLRDPRELPFAYKLALFVLASQVDKLSNIDFTAETTLRIIQSIGSAHPVNWDNAAIFLATADNVPGLDYVISNHVRVISNTAIVTAIEEAASLGRTEALLLLLACPSSDSEPLSLDRALMEAVYASESRCVEAILNDPQNRVTWEGMQSARRYLIENVDVGLSRLLAEHESII